MKTKKRSERKKVNFFKRNFVESLNYIRECKNYVWGIVGVFVFFSLIGFFLPVPEVIQEQILKIIEELLEKTAGMSAGELTVFIFLNNVQSSFFGMIGGLFFGIYSLFVAIANGYLLGFVGALSVQVGGIFVLWRILPHGIFELPAIFISLGMGVRLGTFIFKKKMAEAFRHYFLSSIKTFIFVIIPLLVIAAIIEGFLISFFG